jgi:Abortive infection alpha
MTDDESPAPDLLRGAAGLAQVAVSSSWRLARWTANASVAGTSYVMQRAAAGESAGVIMQEAAQDLRTAAWRALGIMGAPDARATANAERKNGASAAELQRRGTELMRRSNDVHVVEDTHPAYARILSEITPDEARILRFLYLEGPQPSIDVRTNRPLGIGSELVAGGLSMIAEHAGCRNVDQIHQYLTNLSRLGLIEFSKEQVSNPQRYQVVEAQPKVTEAMKRAGRMPKAVHRSIHLNEFGQSFCEACLPVGDVRIASEHAIRTD